MNLDYPFHFDPLGRSAGTDDADHVRDMIEQLLFTNPGERVNRPDFGCGLLQAIFAPNSPELAAALQYTTRAALQRWLGDVVDVHGLECRAEDAALHVQLQYSIKPSGERRDETFVRSLGR